MNAQTIINIDSIISGLRNDIAKLKSLLRPRYKIYRALMSQTGTDDPVVIVLENTLGNIVWTRDSEGLYLGTLAGKFTSDKTWCNVTSGSYASNSIGSINLCRDETEDVVVMTIYGTSGLNTDINDSGSYETSIEIKVYY